MFAVTLQKCKLVSKAGMSNSIKDKVIVSAKDTDVKKSNKRLLCVRRCIVYVMYPVSTLCMFRLSEASYSGSGSVSRTDQVSQSGAEETTGASPPHSSDKSQI